MNNSKEALMIRDLELAKDMKIIKEYENTQAVNLSNHYGFLNA